MKHMKMKNLIISTLVIGVYLFFIFQAPKVEAWGEKYQVQIRNDIDDSLPLGLQCHSSDDDLGSHTLYKGGVFKFHFGLNYFHTTKFVCLAQWSGLKASIYVFNRHLAEKHCGDDRGRNCFWAMRNRNTKMFIPGLLMRFYQVEHVVDSKSEVDKAVMWLYHLEEEIGQIKVLIANLDGNTSNDERVQNIPDERLTPFVSRGTTTKFQEVMVGLNDQKAEIVDRLTRGALRRNVVSIVGMPGIGKTTLARNVFSSPSVLYHFHVLSPDLYSSLPLPTCTLDAPMMSPSFLPNSNYERLRVLDLESINMGSSLADGIESLVELRFLAVSGDMESIPPSLANLENLQTFILKGLKGKVVLPDTIWTMKKLRHIHFSNFHIFTLPLDGRSCQFDRLETLSFPCFKCGPAMHNMRQMFPHLRKLKCVFLRPTTYVFESSQTQFPVLDFLNKLQSLKVIYYGKVLKLISRAFEGSSWDMVEREFVNLKYLKLDTLNIVHWNASDDHLPKLQQLVMRHCKELEEIPLDFANISTLQKIEDQSMLMMMMKGLAFWVLFAAAAAAVLSGRVMSMKRLVVGDKLGWTDDVRVNYTEWAAQYQFFVGDWLYFRFDKYRYNVLEVNQSSYEKCYDQEFMKNLTRGGRDVYELKEARAYYFLSSGGYCYHGLKLAINVTIPPPPPPAPASNGAAAGMKTGSRVVLLQALVAGIEALFWFLGLVI
ncbi:OLC1v1009658C1 [Oldenlandia corymbosa var. corymbosa]|uniref:OLC1v1009658C1 n=1 Tax=Oldenlandia corymbosa var. corymbosa TaxID=529605 RepID=A0AAV1DPE6_OLDCO|nr:OLC1v1009658C1 [Oldenlandia corymbosa var. corymbosa]